MLVDVVISKASGQISHGHLNVRFQRLSQGHSKQHVESMNIEFRSSQSAIEKQERNCKCVELVN